MAGKMQTESPLGGVSSLVIDTVLNVGGIDAFSAGIAVSALPVIRQDFRLGDSRQVSVSD
jgi:hypothetical protein